MKTITENMKAALISFLLIVSVTVNAQHNITGTVNSTTNEPLPGSTVLLLQPADSSLVKANFTNQEGYFSFDGIEQGKYLLSISFVGFETIIRSIETGKAPLSYSLAPSTALLDQVNVVAQKPFIEQEIDRTVINVQNSITNAGSTVLDVLRRSPGIQVNQQAGTISMIGKEGVQVMINGKISYMPAASLLAMLDGMNSNNVKKIELITTPPAKYDAGGNAGYINIVLSQNPNEGFNGSASLTAAGFSGSAPAANLDLNYRKKKINLYGSYSFSRRAQIQQLNDNRSVRFESVNTLTNIASTRDPYQLNNGVRLGMDVALSKKTTMGLLLSGYRNNWKMEAVNTSRVSENGVLITDLAIANVETNRWLHGMANFNIQHKFSADGELNFNIDFLRYNNYNPNAYINNYLENATIIDVREINSSKLTDINILPISLDYSKKINEKLTLETGIKAVQSNFSNDVLVEEKIGETWIPDGKITADYTLKESIRAAYISTNYNHSEKNTFKAGLRYEYTVSNLGSNIEKDIVDRKYGYLFPTIYWKHKINDNHSYNLNYNRRINRPTFNDLAPFLIFIDPNTFASGNAALQPAIADNLSLGFNVKMLNFTVNYAHENYAIGGFQMQVDAENNKVYYIAQNLKFSESLFLTTSFPTKITKWWNGQLNLTAARNRAVADFLEGGFAISTFTYGLSGFQSFKISKRLNAEMSGFFQSRALSGIAIRKPLGQLNVGLGLALPKSNANIKFGVDNLFNFMVLRWKNANEELGYSDNFSLQFQQQILKLTYSKSFGNSKMAGNRKRQTASDEERKRVN
jgi:hypothetical protein